MSKPSKKIVAMELPKPSMGKQIEYEIYYGKKPKEHKEVELSVTLQDSIHWFCRDHRFRVVSVHPDRERTPNAPEPLFYRPFSDNIDEYSYHVNSGPARSKVGVDQFYKPIFEFDDKTRLDPHIRTT
jgi:hypothetical protein